MKNDNNKVRLDFKPVSLSHKDEYCQAIMGEWERGCELSFTNLYIWGEQEIAFSDGAIFVHSVFYGKDFYPYPIGVNDMRRAVDAIIRDASARGIPCRITGLSTKIKEHLEALYPDRFSFRYDEGTFDYVYTVEDLAELKGKAYHAKRNHLNRFKDLCPGYTVERVTDENAKEVMSLAQDWYRARLLDNPSADFRSEKEAIEKALEHREALGIEGLLIKHGTEVLAFTLASPHGSDTYDVHFEKAKGSVQGAYAAINCEFAKYVKEHHPDISFLNREEDMGLEGLRRAKQSYNPHHMVKKWRATLKEMHDAD